MATRAVTRQAENGASGQFLQRDGRTGQRTTAHEDRITAVMAAAERSGLLENKDGRIGGRVSLQLVQQAKQRTGIETDTDLIEFALANIALEDRFAETFAAMRGKVDPDITLGY